MGIHEFIFLTSFLIALSTRFSLGQKLAESITRDSEISRDNEKRTINFDDLVIEIVPPTGRENISTTREPVVQHWDNNDDDSAHWESFYGSTDDIANFEDSSKINNDTVEPEPAGISSKNYTNEKDDIKGENIERTNEKIASNLKNDSLTKQLSRYERSINLSSRELNERIYPSYVDTKLSNRRKRSSKQKAFPSKPVKPCTVDKRCCKNRANSNVNRTKKKYRRSFDDEKMLLMSNLRTPEAVKYENSALNDYVKAHLSRGHELALNMHDRARLLAARGFCPNPHTASMLNLIHSKADNDLVSINEESEFILFGTKLLQQRFSKDYNITSSDFDQFLNHFRFPVNRTRFCRKTVSQQCDPYAKYRSLDGSCNNVDYSSWGQANTAFERILRARYSDGIHAMPISVTSAELPNARELSTRLFARGAKYDPELTLAVMQWGQTLAHDMARQVPVQTTEEGIECCGQNGRIHLDKNLQHHSCAPISISPMDNFYRRHGQRCMNFVRSMTLSRVNCTLGPANQLNAVTSFLDCSQMYGVSESQSNELREFTDGRLKVEFRNGRCMLPTTKNPSVNCDIWTSDDLCYRSVFEIFRLECLHSNHPALIEWEKFKPDASPFRIELRSSGFTRLRLRLKTFFSQGDPRTSQNPQLVVLHTLLVREHNRVASILSALNSYWTDERIFQETRRIVIAEYQHITYNEWLPLLLGDHYATRNDLLRTKRRMSNDYNENVDPSTIIGFTTGAFRSLHSIVPGNIGVCNVSRDFINVLRLDNHFFRPGIIERNNNFEGLLRGLVTQSPEMQDMTLTSQLTEYLFRSRNDFGMDLASIDIQRGRDHGLPGYNAYRKICNLQPAEDFDDLYEEISWENIRKLRREYAHVNDIDLIVGAYMENILPGSRFGPTNRCIIGEQFYRSRVGDRYFYDNVNFPHSFTTEQFDEITKVTLASLLCDTENNVGAIQLEAFRALSPKNPLVACKKLPQMDLTLWKE